MPGPGQGNEFCFLWLASELVFCYSQQPNYVNSVTLDQNSHIWLFRFEFDLVLFCEYRHFYGEVEIVDGVGPVDLLDKVVFRF